jgi:hypothetical protein
MDDDAQIRLWQREVRDQLHRVELRELNRLARAGNPVAILMLMERYERARKAASSSTSTKVDESRGVDLAIVQPRGRA